MHATLVLFDLSDFQNCNGGFLCYQCCRDKHKFECDAWSSQDILSRGAVETLRYVGTDGEVRLVRIPSGRAHELLERATQDGSMDAKEAIRWQDEKVPEKIQLGLALDLMEALLR